MESLIAARTLQTDSKYQITEKSILIVFFLICFTTLGNLVDIFRKPIHFQEHIFYLQTDLIALIVTALLGVLHRKGYSRLASILLLLFMVGVISSSFSPADLNRIMIIYALPILMASFLIGPTGSFVFALVSTLGYSLAWIASALTNPAEFSIINISLFYGLAGLSWMVATQVNHMVKKLKTDEHRLKEMINLYQMQDSSVQQIAGKSLDESVWLTLSAFGYLAFTSADESSLTVAACSKPSGETGALEFLNQAYPISESSLWSEVFRQRRPVITNKYSITQTGKFKLPCFPYEIVQRHLIVPVFDGKRIAAVLGVANKTQPYDESDANRLALLARQVWSLVERQRMVEELERSNQDLAEAYENTLAGWVRTLEERNKETQQHSQRVADLSVQLAQTLGLQDEAIQHLRRGALLHDIGKMGIPDEILLKKGPLNDQEWEIMRRHPEIAYKILSPIKFLQPALDVPYYHHERWDGTGYPFGLRETEIPMAARIFAVVDVWEAVTHDRVYHPAWPQEKAIAYMEEQAGLQFDPLIVEVFLTEVIGVPMRLPEEMVTA